MSPVIVLASLCGIIADGIAGLSRLQDCSTKARGTAQIAIARDFFDAAQGILAGVEPCRGDGVCGCIYEPLPRIHLTAPACSDVTLLSRAAMRPIPGMMAAMAAA